MKKRNFKTLKLSKQPISRLEPKEIDKLKGGSGTYCNTCFDCWLH